MKPHDRSEDVTESTDVDVSFRTPSERHSDTDITFLLPLKQNDGGKEPRSMLRRSDSSKGTSSFFSEDSTSFPMSQQRVAELITPMSQQRVSEIFLREKCLGNPNSFFYQRESKSSRFVSDMQALFDSHELMELDDDLDELPENSSTTTTPTETPTSSSAKRSTLLTFGEVEIREYPIIPGDSPAGLKGHPLTIDWKPVTTVRIPHIDKYEEVREGHRRVTKELQMKPEQRMDILRNQGFPRAEIQKSIKQANIARRQRKDTVSTLKHQATYEKMESIQRKAHNLLTFGKRNKAKKEYLKKYVPSYYDGIVEQ